MNKYQNKKAELYNFAILWQAEFADKNYSYAELAVWGEFWTKQGRRFGLLRELRENGII
jgi:hypothetical protein